jgi:hypothetical protein
MSNVTAEFLFVVVLVFVVLLVFLFAVFCGGTLRFLCNGFGNVLW